MKQKMIALLQRCVDLINGEVSLLQNWRDSGAMSPAGSANCQRSIEQITIGETASKTIVDNIFAKANALNDSDVKNNPSDSAADFVANLEKNLATRSTWDGPSLEQPWLESALAQAEDNAAHAADCASGILADCTA